MDNTKNVYELLDLVQTIYNKGRLDPFISFIDSQNRILIYLLSHENAHPSSISDELNVSRSNIANCLKQLEALKYIERDINADNRREIYVNITAEGKVYIMSLINEICELFSMWLNILGDEAPHLIKILQLSSTDALVDDRFYKLAEDLKKNSKVIEEDE